MGTPQAAADARDSLLSSPEVDAVAVASLSRGFADDSEWAIAQWANCGPLDGRPLRDFRAIPASKPYDFCGFLLGSGDPVLVRLAEESPLPVTAARAFLHGGGSDAEAKALASSGAHARSLRIGDDDAPSDAVARFVAAADANATAVAKALGKGVTEDHVLALRAYVISFASAFVTPLVPWLLTKESANGGMVVRRTANELLFGYEDPLLALKTSKGSPEAQVAIVAHYDELESDLANLTVPEDEATENGKFPLTNGLTVTVLDSGTRAGQYRRHDGKIAVAFPSGIETVAGTAGVAFGQHLDALETQEVWHPELSHGLPYSYDRPTLLTTRDVRLRLRRYELAEAGLAPCSAANPRRCVYPDHVQGVWNATHAYEGTPLYFSQPHFVGVAEDIFDAYTNAGDDEAARIFDGYRALGGSANTSDVVRARAHERHYDVEPWTGLALAGRVTTQYNVLARRSDILYPNLGSDNAITIGKVRPCVSTCAADVPVCTCACECACGASMRRFTYAMARHADHRANPHPRPRARSCTGRSCRCIRRHLSGRQTTKSVRGFTLRSSQTTSSRCASGSRHRWLRGLLAPGHATVPCASRDSLTDRRRACAPPLTAPSAQRGTRNALWLRSHFCLDARVQAQSGARRCQVEGRRTK